MSAGALLLSHSKVIFICNKFNTINLVIIEERSQYSVVTIAVGRSGTCDAVAKGLVKTCVYL